MLEKIIFIAHSYHKKTKSCDFLIDYLRNFFEVEVMYDEEWDTGKKINWELFNNSYKAVIIWQMFPREGLYKKITNDNIIYFPMYDQVEKWHFKKWYECKELKFVCFSYTLHKKLQKYGFNSMHIQYFIEPKEFSPGVENEIFFWQRHTKININTVKKLIKNKNFKIHIHKTVDPGQMYLQPELSDENHYKITYSEWFDTKQEMLDVINKKAIYIAPRFSEGIGLSFLEAISMGKVVIAHNKPTMSEYIKNGKTGFLCNFKCPFFPVKLSNIQEIQRNTYEYAKAGYEKWLINRENIVNFINAPKKTPKLKLFMRIFLPLLFFDIKRIIKFKLGTNAHITLFGIKIFNKESN